MKRSAFYDVLRRFPADTVIIAAYIVLGACFHLWHPGWLIFFLIPLWHSVLSCIRFHSIREFSYPVFALLLFFILGFFFRLWNPAWVLFLTIPVWHTLMHALQQRRALLHTVLPVLALTVYLVLGFAFRLWHPGWVVFLIIPVGDALLRAYRHDDRRGDRRDEDQDDG